MFKGYVGGNDDVLGFRVTDLGQLGVSFFALRRGLLFRVKDGLYGTFHLRSGS